jgi:hypothetical protein
VSASPTAAPAPRSAPADLSEVNVSERARRFLKPIVGIDPASVTIVKGPAVDEIHSAQHTDALAIGDDTVLVKSDFTGELPRDLGLLAHELTHIARERRPRFIPPAARSRRGMATEPSEEAVARRVEGRAIALANDSAAQRAVSDRGYHDASHQAQAETVDVTPVVGAPMPLATRPTSEWGGLPAPWEPLPAWLSEPETTAHTSTQAHRSVEVPALPIASSSAPMTVATSAPAIQPAVHAADAARVIDPPAAPAAPAAGEGQPPVAPDIDQLARQVYAALKRRLEADARRERMFRG